MANQRQAIWDDLNKQGSSIGPWNFIWGSSDIDEIKKGLVDHGFLASRLDEWLDMLSPRFPLKTPRKMIVDGEHEELWLFMYEVGSGVFS